MYQKPLITVNDMEDKELALELGKKAIEDSIKTAREFVDKLVGPALEESGGVLADTIKFWRLKHQINILLKAQDFLVSKGIDPARVLPKTLIPILEYGSLEEDAEMQNRWSALLANAANPEFNNRARPSYPEILKQLSPLEAKILDNIFNATEKLTSAERANHGIVAEKVLKVFSLTMDEYQIIVNNLVRLGVCEWPTSKGGMTIGNAPMILQTYDFIFLSPMGRDFVRMCRLV